MTPDDALVTALRNLRGGHPKEYIETAKALRVLKDQPQFGSNAAVGKAVASSAEIVREFLCLLELPERAQQLLERRELKLEHGRRLCQLKQKREIDVPAATEAMVGLTAFDARHLVEYLLKNPDVSVAEAKSRLLSEKTVTIREYHVVAILSDSEFTQLGRLAKQRGHRTPSALVTEIVKEWLVGERANVTE